MVGVTRYSRDQAGRRNPRKMYGYTQPLERYVTLYKLFPQTSEPQFLHLQKWESQTLSQFSLLKFDVKIE